MLQILIQIQFTYKLISLSLYFILYLYIFQASGFITVQAWDTSYDHPAICAEFPVLIS
jgi:hypothetical protein